jgi:hypothetical protein
MTAATVEAPPLATVLGLVHPSARRLADQLATVPEPSLRREAAGRALADRRADLGLYRTLLVERYGKAPALEQIIADDDLYADLAILAIA